jgi:hypothetical protein
VHYALVTLALRDTKLHVPCGQCVCCSSDGGGGAGELCAQCTRDLIKLTVLGGREGLGHWELLHTDSDHDSGLGVAGSTVALSLSCDGSACHVDEA